MIKFAKRLERTIVQERHYSSRKKSGEGDMRSSARGEGDVLFQGGDYCGICQRKNNTGIFLVMALLASDKLLVEEEPLGELGA
ncbi:MULTISPECIES: hypothetical protein [unclassified Adlercreutzia]|uniref:hypothetical protein n=1 Tax=unclassified Adlercreutzia TaxID=2636013 RepID=UPI0013EA811F|nr:MULTISPECIES: hypothetical protein [unclassified Adlercreutzia]